MEVPSRLLSRERSRIACSDKMDQGRLQEQGYNTYYTGKPWNGHTVDNYNTPTVKGFNGSDFLLDPYTYQYYNARSKPFESSSKYMR